MSNASARAAVVHHLQRAILAESSSVSIVGELTSNLRRLRSLKSRQDKGDLSAASAEELSGLLTRNQTLARQLESMLEL